MADGLAIGAAAPEDHSSSPNRGTGGQVQWKVEQQHSEANREASPAAVEQSIAGHMAGNVQAAVESMLIHSKSKTSNAADRINYTFLTKPKASVAATQEKMWTWDTIQQLAGLEDTSNEAEAERTELIRRVFTYELMSK
jgi:hypothetical protein